MSSPNLSEQMVNKQVAVYGTLRKGGGNHHILYGIPFDTDTISGYEMYSLGGFPYVIKSEDPESKITVEVYTVDNYRTAVNLDRLEGYHSIRGFDGS